MIKKLLIFSIAGFCSAVFAGYPVPTGTAGIDAIRVDQVLPSVRGEVSRVRNGVATYYGKSCGALTTALSGRQAGDIIRLPAGTFNINGALLNNITLEGVSPEQTIINSPAQITLQQNARLENITLNITQTGISQALAVSQSNVLVSNVRINANEASHGVLMLGVSNRLERVSAYDCGYHGIAVKGAYHKLLHCYADHAVDPAGNALIIKSDNNQSNNNTTHDIEVLNFTGVGAIRGVTIHAHHQHSETYNITIDGLRIKECNRIVDFKTGQTSAVISNILVDAVSINDKYQIIGGGAVYDCLVFNKGQLINNNENSDDL